jgi:hypothetical protein
MLIDPGHYRALLWKEDNKAWTVDQALGIHVNVEVSPFDWHARLALLGRRQLMTRKCRQVIRLLIQEGHLMGDSHLHLMRLASPQPLCPE